MLTIENKNRLRGCQMGTWGVIYELTAPIEDVLEFPTTGAKLDVYSILLTPMKQPYPHKTIKRKEQLVHLERNINKINGLYMLGFDGDVGFLITDWVTFDEIKEPHRILTKISNLLQKVPDHLL